MKPCFRIKFKNLLAQLGINKYERSSFIGMDKNNCCLLESQATEVVKMLSEGAEKARHTVESLCSHKDFIYLRLVKKTGGLITELLTALPAQGGFQISALHGSLAASHFSGQRRQLLLHCDIVSRYVFLHTQ